jgi:PHB de-polymerase C-terminus
MKNHTINIIPVRNLNGSSSPLAQLTAFVSVNLERHIEQHVDLANHLARGEKEKAELIKTFYDEYFAVMDLPAEFYMRMPQGGQSEACPPSRSSIGDGWRARRFAPLPTLPLNDGLLRFARNDDATALAAPPFAR